MTHQDKGGQKNKICDIVSESFLTALSRQLTNYHGNLFPEKEGGSTSVSGLLNNYGHCYDFE